MDARRKRRVAHRRGPAASKRLSIVDRLTGGVGELTQPEPIFVHRPSFRGRTCAGHLGSYGRAKSTILSPPRINYLDVQLAAGERWTYEPPSDHEVVWLAVSVGSIRTPDPVSAGEFVAFEEANGALFIQADRASRFVLGSAAKHPHELVLGQYSVHTSRASLVAGESQIERIGNQLVAAGLLR